MSRKTDPRHLAHVRQLYESGQFPWQIALALGRPLPTVYNWLHRSGVKMRDQSTTMVNALAGRGAAISAGVVAQYVTGISENVVAANHGVSRTAVRRLLRRAGVQIRDCSAAGFLRMASAAQRGAVARKAHFAKVGRGELDMLRMLRSLGMEADRQVIVAPYNLDLAIGSVAVEIHWRTINPLRPCMRQRERIKNLLDRGWSVIYVWCTDPRPLRLRAAKEVVAFADLANRDPSARREYRVIRGCGELVAGGHLEGDQLPVIPTLEGREYAAR